MKKELLIVIGKCTLVIAGQLTTFVILNKIEDKTLRKRGTIKRKV